VTQVARGAQRWGMTQSNWTQSEERSERGALVHQGWVSEFCAQRQPISTINMLSTKRSTKDDTRALE